MAIKNFGVGCCCRSDHYTCNPCTCFEFYNPNTLESVDANNIDLFWQPVAFYHCPYISGNCTYVEYTSGYAAEPHTVSGYSAGDVVCTVGRSTSSYPYTGEPGSGCFYGDLNSDDGCFYNPLKIACGNVVNIFCGGFYDSINAPGYGSGYNAAMKFNVMAYPKDLDPNFNILGSCPSIGCGISWDICSGPTGQHVCIPVPYCPTPIELKWDAALFALVEPVGQTFIPWPFFVTESCPYGFFNSFPYEGCGGSTCLIPNGSCNTTAFPIVIWNSDVDLYTVWSLASGQCPTTNMPVFATNLPYNYGVAVGLGENVVLPLQSKLVGDCWSATYLREDCLYQEINLCQSNTIQLSVTNKGQGSWTGTPGNCWQFCPDGDYCCYTTVYCGQYPIEPLTVSISTTKTITILGQSFSVGLSFNGSVLPDSDNHCPPGFPPICSQAPVAMPYVDTCFGNTTAGFPVLVTEVVTCEGNGSIGIGNVSLESTFVGFPGYSPPGLGVMVPGTSDPFTQPGACPNAYIGVNFNAWDCAGWYANQPAPRRACFDCDTLTFQGWTTQDDCCGCDCHPDCGKLGEGGCKYCFADVQGTSVNGFAYGTIDLCSNVIMLTIYDSQWNIIGTISL